MHKNAHARLIMKIIIIKKIMMIKKKIKKKAGRSPM